MCNDEHLELSRTVNFPFVHIFRFWISVFILKNNHYILLFPIFVLLHKNFPQNKMK